MYFLLLLLDFRFTFQMSSAEDVGDYLQLVFSPPQ
jgi:hypothetical protein